MTVHTCWLLANKIELRAKASMTYDVLVFPSFGILVRLLSGGSVIGRSSLRFRYRAILLEVPLLGDPP